MKKLRILTFLLSCIAVLGMTSCNDDTPANTETPLTDSQIAYGFSLLKGTHTGILVHGTGEYRNGKQINDTVKVSWEFQNDSSLVIHKVPGNILAANITDIDIRKTMVGQGEQDIRCRYSFVSVDPLVIAINPKPQTYEKLNYNGKDHKVELLYLHNSAYSAGAIDKQSQQFAMQVIALAIRIDDKQYQTFKTANALMFYSDDKIVLPGTAR